MTAPLLPAEFSSPAANGALSRDGAIRGDLTRGDVAQSNSATQVVAARKAAALASPVVLSVPTARIATFHMNGLGDLLFTLPALHALREGFPGAKISCVVRPGLAPLLRDSPFVDEILIRPRGGLSRQTALIRRLRSMHVDLCVAFSQSRNTSMLSWTSGAATRLGYEDAHLENLLTHRVPGDVPPTIETHLNLVAALGCPIHKRDYTGLPTLSPTTQKNASDLLEKNGVGGAFVLVACEASARRGIKEWPVEHWESALDALAPRLPVVLVGTEPTTNVTEKLQHHVIGNRVLDLGGQTDLPTLAALCGMARVFVGIDSGVLHLAASMGTPVVGIFGPTDWRKTGPRGVPQRIVRHAVECSPCLLSQCKWSGKDARKCLTRLEPNQVVEAVRELIGI